MRLNIFVFSPIKWMEVNLFHEMLSDDTGDGMRLSIMPVHYVSHLLEPWLPRRVRTRALLSPSGAPHVVAPARCQTSRIVDDLCPPQPLLQIHSRSISISLNG